MTVDKGAQARIGAKASFSECGCQCQNGVQIWVVFSNLLFYFSPSLGSPPNQDFHEGCASIFLLTSLDGGLGLTVTKADCVIVLDPAWNPWYTSLNIGVATLFS
ncbi:hypothetical protein GIB67_007174 [Kingdonia uniflora]|uniref:Uncharacterized protein n=1 Tax=Kingdonia uniflora TaxID=39325 RepID=A0A7J7MLM1_9MAGN|nr:hypothetical protein GIB67_007174 [Kingdonia uniflora]